MKNHAEIEGYDIVKCKDGAITSVHTALEEDALVFIGNLGCPYTRTVKSADLELVSKFGVGGHTCLDSYSWLNEKSPQEDGTVGIFRHLIADLPDDILINAKVEAVEGVIVLDCLAGEQTTAAKIRSSLRLIKDDSQLRIRTEEGLKFALTTTFTRDWSAINLATY